MLKRSSFKSQEIENDAVKAKITDLINALCGFLNENEITEILEPRIQVNTTSNNKSSTFSTSEEGNLKIKLMKTYSETEKVQSL